MLKCSQCGRDVLMVQIGNGYIGECCNEVHFHPRSTTFIPAVVEEQDDDERGGQ